MIPVYDTPLIQQLVADYFCGNEAARLYAKLCSEEGKSITVDHITLRCFNIERRAKEFQALGYLDQDELIEYPDQGWWAKVYRKPAYPALFVDQAYDDTRGQTSIIPKWVERFGDRTLHHVAVRVEDIEAAVSSLQAREVLFAGPIVGGRGTRLRQVFTASEVRDGTAFSVLELTERNGYDGFYPEQADSLMQSSLKTKS